jgi:2-oxo-4-hydroxy-4-carboxy-5-ureidoimidazoline decarboxylase
MNLGVLNAMTDDEAHDAFMRCCGSSRWSDEITRARPFESEAALIEIAERIWWELSRDDWLEAFGAHPRIGDNDALRAKFASTAAWARREQSGAQVASEDVLNELAMGNRQYEARFGYIFIVCATGKTAEEMLELLRQRLVSDVEAEINLAAAEQMKITLIRLERIAP